MDLLQGLAVLCITLFLAQYVMVNVLGVSTEELSRKHQPKTQTPPAPETQIQPPVSTAQPGSNSPALDEIELKLRKEFGLDEGSQMAEKLQLLPDALVQQAVYNEHTKGVLPQNQDLGSQQNAQFGNEQTNVAEFFQSNPAAFLTDQRHTAYVPNVDNWNKQGQDLYDQHMNAPRQMISAANNHQYGQYSMASA